MKISQYQIINQNITMTGPKYRFRTSRQGAGGRVGKRGFGAEEAKLGFYQINKRYTGVEINYQCFLINMEIYVYLLSAY